MINYIRMALRARTSERGATAVEYGLLIAVIAIALIAGMSILAGGIDTLFRDAKTELTKDHAPTT